MSTHNFCCRCGERQIQLTEVLEIKETLGEIVSRAKLRQLRVAESERFAQVTFFFNGGTHAAFAGEKLAWFYGVSTALDRDGDYAKT